MLKMAVLIFWALSLWCYLHEKLNNIPAVNNIPRSYDNPASYNANQAKYVYRDMYRTTKRKHKSADKTSTLKVSI
jgi:hypothetical protein